MAEENIKEVVEEIKNDDEETIRKTVENWYEKIHTQSMKLGAKFISAAIFGVIQKHLKKGAKPSLRDYQRAIDEIIKIISVQLTEQSDLKEENENDGATE